MTGKRHAAVAVVVWLALGGVPAAALGPERLSNGGFEEAGRNPSFPSDWVALETPHPPPVNTWDDTVARSGYRSARVDVRNRWGYWSQSLTLAPNRTYLLSGWIRTEDVSSSGVPNAGAHLGLFAPQFERHTPGVTGTSDWTLVRLVFNSGPTGNVRVTAQVGIEWNRIPGVAWFDDISIREIEASDPHPRWKILVLIYDRTDFTYTEGSGIHHLVGTIPASQVAAAAANAALFVETDIPALSSGNMIPELTIRYPGMLSRLSRQGGGWWPSPDDTADARDPAFDSVIVIWQPSITDQATGEPRWIGSAAGLAAYRGVAQTYAAIIIEAATLYGHRNVFKHEWGHSLLFYYDAAGTAPTPTVSNHTEETTYVHCGTGQYYDWRDELQAAPIPNSIYNNQSGFTHDYYSGTTALAGDPLTCLGITPAAWATGGPVSLPAPPTDTSPLQGIHDIRLMLDQLVEAGAVGRQGIHPLEHHLDRAALALQDDDAKRAIKEMRQFRQKVDKLPGKRITPEARRILRGRADVVIDALQAS